jgi:hypothetical protein
MASGPQAVYRSLAQEINLPRLTDSALKFAKRLRIAVWPALLYQTLPAGANL